MQIFKLQKGGEVENPETVIVTLRRIIDDELLKKAINICAENNFNVIETLSYLDEQFDCVEYTSFSDLETFYC